MGDSPSDCADVCTQIRGLQHQRRCRLGRRYNKRLKRSFTGAPIAMAQQFHVAAIGEAVCYPYKRNEARRAQTVMQANSQSAGSAGNGLAQEAPSPAGQSIRVERKHFTFDLRENPRGKFLRITEEVNGRHDAIVVPLTGLKQFRDALDEMIKASHHSADHP